MADSGTYDLSTIQRRQKIAEQMSAEAVKPRQIQHWAQGLAQLGEVGASEFALNRLDKQEKAALLFEDMEFQCVATLPQQAIDLSGRVHDVQVYSMAVSMPEALAPEARVLESEADVGGG